MDVGPYGTDLLFTQKSSDSCLSMVACSPYSSSLGAVQVELNAMDVDFGSGQNECFIEKKFQLNTDWLKRNMFGSLVIMVDLSQCTATPTDCEDQALKISVKRTNVSSSIPIETKTVIFVMVGVIAGGLGLVLSFKPSTKPFDLLCSL